MRRAYKYIVIAAAAAFLVSGCETVPKKYKEEVSGIKSRVDTLESRVDTVESRQAETERMAMEQAQVVQTNISPKPKSGKDTGSKKDIQRCLKNAGFYTGKIDGVIGKNTKKAIRGFQEANGLKVDGVVGKRTWELLSAYQSGEGAPSITERAVK